VLVRRHGVVPPLGDEFVESPVDTEPVVQAEVPR
jgi:hypothetical protein